MKKTYIILSLLIFLAVFTQARAQQVFNQTKTIQQRTGGPVYNFHFNNGGAQEATPKINTAASQVIEDNAPILIPKKEKLERSLVFTTMASNSSVEDTWYENSDYDSFKPFIESESAYSLGLKIALGNGFSITPAVMLKEISTYSGWETYEGSAIGGSLSFSHQGKADFLGFMGLQGGLNINYAKAQLNKSYEGHDSYRDIPGDIDNAESLNVTGYFGLRMEMGSFAIVPTIHYGKGYHKLEYADGHQKYDTGLSGARLNFELKI